MAKNNCETSLALSISFLKKHGYLNGSYQNGTLTWTRDWSEDKSSVGINAWVFGDDPHFRINYTHTSFGGEKNDLDYRISLNSTPCFFGGKRYWFLCPLIRNNIPCQNRVGVLYCAGKYYGCRQCHDLAYQSQQVTHAGAWSVLSK